MKFCSIYSEIYSYSSGFSNPLLEYSLINSKLFDGVYVSTDCKKIAKISKKYGAIVHFLISKKLSNDNENANDNYYYYHCQ